MSESRIVLITGANSGIGFHIVRALYSADKPYTIIVGGRSLAKAQDAINAIESEFPSSSNELVPLQVDITDDDSIQKAYDVVQAKFGKLDALINNAGAQFDHLSRSGELTMREAWNKSWDVNTVGTQIITSTFIPLLLQSTDPRILFLTSGVSTLQGTENMSLPANKPAGKGWPKTTPSVLAYRSAKTGLNMVMRDWHRILRDDGVKVWAISPGFLATGLSGNVEILKQMGAGDPAVSGPFVRGVLEGVRDADVGKVIDRNGIQPW